MVARMSDAGRRSSVNRDTNIYTFSVIDISLCAVDMQICEL